MVKYKSKATKVQMTSAEAEAASAEKAEEDARLEAERLENERLASEERQRVWDARPGPLPIGWGSSVEAASGHVFYWRQNDPTGTQTWDRPAACGEPALTEKEVNDLFEELSKQLRPPRGAEWQWCLQRLWPEEETDMVCNLQRPGFQDDNELERAIKLLRYFLKGPRRACQDSLSCARHDDHEKLPRQYHGVTAMQRLIDLLSHDEEDVQRAAANCLAAACHSGHRPCQDALGMSVNAMSQLVAMLQEESLTQVACLAMGYACERGHKGNQDALSMVPEAAERLLDLLDSEDSNIARSTDFCIFWAVCGASKSVRTLWERSRGYCMSLMAPKPPLHNWAEATTRGKGRMLEMKEGAATNDKAAFRAANLASRRATYVTPMEKALAAMEDAPEPEDVPFNQVAKIKGKESRKRHVPVALNQDPSHAHLHLSTRRAASRQKEHMAHQEERKQEAKMKKSASLTSHKSVVSLTSHKSVKSGKSVHGMEDLKALRDHAEDVPAPLVFALSDFPDQDLPSPWPMLPPALIDKPAADKNDGARGYGTLATMDSPRSIESELEREKEEHDLHHLDHGLDDTNICRIGTEVRHCVPTGFLKPSNTLARHGMCT